jgi:hypothetical protein
MPAAKSSNAGLALRLKQIRDPQTGQPVRYQHVSEVEQQEAEVYDELDDPQEQEEQQQEEEEEEQQENIT